MKISLSIIIVLLMNSALADGGGLAGGSNSGGKGNSGNKFTQAILKVFKKNQKITINESSSWEEIQKAVKSNHKLITSGGTLFITQPVSAFDACINGDELNTVRKFPIYKSVYVGKTYDRDNESDGFMTKAVRHEILSYPIEYEREYDSCWYNNSQCEVKIKTVRQENVKPIKIKKLMKTDKYGKQIYKTLFTKDYMLPSCI